MSDKVTSKTFLVRFDAETGKLITEMAKAERSVSQKIGAMGTSMQRVGKSMTRSLTLPIVGFLGASAKMAMDFDTTMTRMQTLVGLTADEIATLRPEIIKTASEYGKSAQEAAEAMYFITSSGIKGEAAMAALEQSLLASALGMGETQVIADMLTSAMNAYGPEALNAAKATDFLIAAIREGKAEPDALAGAMSRVLPVASNMGVEFEQVAAAFAALSTSGTNADEAATQLRGILGALLKPGKAAEKQLKEMGLSSEGLRKVLKDKGLLALLSTLRTEFKGNGSAIAGVFGNVRALTGILDLTGNKWEKVVATFNNVAAAEGLGEQNKAVLENSAGFKYQKAMEGFKNSMIGFGDAVAPEIEKITKAFEGLSGTLNKMDPATRKLVTMAALIVAALGPVLWIVGKITSAVMAVIGAFKKFPLLGKVFGKLLPGALPLAALGVLDKAAGAGKPEITARREANAATQRGTIPTNESIIRKQIEDLRLRNPEAAARFEAKMRAAGKIRAIGGTVSAGSSYLVGERGPELLTPTSNAWITPNNRLGGGSTPINVTVNVQGSVVRERDLAVSIRDQMAQMMRRRGLDPAILGV